MRIHLQIVFVLDAPWEALAEIWERAQERYGDDAFRVNDRTYVVWTGLPPVTTCRHVGISTPDSPRLARGAVFPVWPSQMFQRNRWSGTPPEGFSDFLNRHPSP